MAAAAREISASGLFSPEAQQGAWKTRTKNTARTLFSRRSAARLALSLACAAQPADLDRGPAPPGRAGLSSHHVGLSGLDGPLPFCPLPSFQLPERRSA
eukprot:3994550-Pleurochrysis_carterae.AAC.2